MEWWQIIITIMVATGCIGYLLGEWKKYKK